MTLQVPFCPCKSRTIWKPRPLFTLELKVFRIKVALLFFDWLTFSSWNGQFKKSSLWDKTGPKPLLQINRDQAKIIYLTKNYHWTNFKKKLPRVITSSMIYLFGKWSIRSQCSILNPILVSFQHRQIPQSLGILILMEHSTRRNTPFGLVAYFLNDSESQRRNIW